MVDENRAAGGNLPSSIFDLRSSFISASATAGEEGFALLGVCI
jgi:hypothetical protein